VLLAIYFAVGALAIECLAGGDAANKCTPDKCESVGNAQICTDCQTGNVPINGVCADATASEANCKNKAGNGKADQTCEQCLNAYFMYKGGCYQTTQQPGQSMCAGASDGKCDTPADGKTYFVVPGATKTDQSVVACGDTTGVTVDTNKKYVGVDGCAKCDAPESLSAAGTATATCTECNANLYLKTVSSPTPTKSCVTEAACKEGSTHFPTTDSSNGDKKVCVSCSQTSNGGIADCAKCSLTTSPAGAGAAVTCTECDSTKKLSPLKDACLDGCPAGTYEIGDTNKVCTPCHASCAECNNNANQDSCTACYPGSVLSKGETGNTGTCIPECTGRYTENCEAGMCTAVLGGSKYCSKCKSGYVPVDGLCVSAGTRAAPNGCISKGDGTCASCTSTYFKESGGCYLSTAYPGKTLCSNAADGKCKTCTNGQTADTSTGVCPACPAGCSKCSGNSDPRTCSECLAGYYKSGTSCVKCSENSNGIQGVPNCVSCKEPSSGSGPVTCYVTQEPTADPTDPSTNKTGLSSGTIAGISVAVIVVVGGLIGFLCWWFICRGKA
ncbi:Variant-specific surface protein, partial [Giardia duodenalis]